MRTPAHVSLDVRDGIITVTIDRQDKLNAISPEVTSALWDATRLLSERDDLCCLVITAVGKYFTAGMDLSTPLEPPSHPARAARPGWGFRRDYRRHHLLYDEFEAIEKPIIQAVQGICLGAGVEMATSCDFRFCSPRAEFALPEIDLGLIPASGGASRLTRLVGPVWAKWMAMAGMRVDAEQAKAIGLVHDIYPEDTLMDSVYAFCDRLKALPADALGLAKLAVDMAVDSDPVAQRNVDRIINTTLAGNRENTARTARFRK